MSADAKGRTRGRWGRKLAILAGVALYALVRAPAATEPAVADGDTRTLTFVNHHTNESDSFTYRVNGQYDQAVLEKLNWFMRDWRLNEPTHMDPRLFDIIWEVNRGAGSGQPIDVLSAYRSPQTNAMLHRRSRLVAEHSQHMLGKAIDAHFVDVGTGTIRDVAMRMQEGGVGFYPIGSTPWVHIDSGAVRYWPRMSRASLARLFPDGKTVFIPADGQPMERYAEAKALLESRGEEVQTASSGGGGGGLLGMLFGGARGGGADDDEETAGASVIASGRGGQVVASLGRGVAFAPPPPVTKAPVLAAAPAPPPPPAPSPPLSEVVALAPSTPTPADMREPVADAAPPAPAAPLPPRRPANLFGGLDAPSPPRRPADLDATPGQGGHGEIASLIARNALPEEISRGPTSAKPAAHDAALPKSALALTESKPAASGDALARAAMLAAPMPPLRPRIASEDGVSAAARAPTPLARPTPTPLLRPSVANPFGDLVIDAFAAPTPSDRAARTP